jgi:hypothetical protein
LLYFLEQSEFFYISDDARFNMPILLIIFIAFVLSGCEPSVVSSGETTFHTTRREPDGESDLDRQERERREQEEARRQRELAEENARRRQRGEPEIPQQPGPRQPIRPSQPDPLEAERQREAAAQRLAQENQRRIEAQRLDLERLQREQAQQVQAERDRLARERQLREQLERERVANAQELQRLDSLDWASKTNRGIFTEIYHLIEEIEAGRQGDEFLVPFRVGFTNYFSRVAAIPGIDQVKFSSEPNIISGHNFDLIEFRDGLDPIKTRAELQSTNKTLPIMLSVMAKQWPNREVFTPTVFSANQPWNKLTAFQQLVSTSSPQAIVEARALLQDNATRAALLLNTPQNTPFAFVASREMLQAVLSGMGVNNVQADCKLSNPAPGGQTLRTLGCAIRREASLDVIRALIENGADISRPELLPQQVFPVTIAARRGNFEVYQHLRPLSPRFLAIGR